MTATLAGKVAVITGGVSGIGLGSVELFVAEGAKVVVGDIQDESGAALAARFPDQVDYLHADVADETQVEALVLRAVERFGRL
ncbi:MAG: linX, partial [Frankiales bacterium]|nr:linX [Frankiales bacterium]